MNEAASHLASRGEPQRARKGKVFKDFKGVGKRKLLAKNPLFEARSPS